jgi:hypothetical protein
MKLQLVLIEFDNCGPFVERFTSKRKITIERVAKFIQNRDGANWDRDSITFVDEPETTMLETPRKPRLTKAV